MYIDFETNNNSYKCKLSVRALVDIERELHDNPINIIGEMSKQRLPEFNKLCAILFHSMKDMNHGIKRDDIYAIIDDYFESGKSMLDLLGFVIELLEKSGCLGKPEEPEEAPAEDSERKN